VATALAGTELANVVQLCGIVVPPEDPAAMTNAVLELAGNAPWRAQLGQAGRHHALQQIDRESVLQRFEKSLSSQQPDAIEQT